MQKLFYAILIAIITIEARLELCSHEVIIKIKEFNHNFSLSVLHYNIDMNFSITENLFNTKGIQIDSLTYSLNLKKNIPKDKFQAFFTTPFSHIQNIELVIEEKGEKNENLQNTKSKLPKSFTFPLDFNKIYLFNQYNINKAPTARYLERAYSCKKLTKSLELNTYNSKTMGLFYIDRSLEVKMIVIDDFNRNNVVEKTAARKYTRAEINELDRHYDFSRFE